MGALFVKIRQLVLGGRYLIGQHAAERLEQRGILEWQIVDGIESGTLIAEEPNDVPNPSVEVHQLLADATPVKAVWSLLISMDVSKLVTVHFFDEQQR